MDDYKVKDTIDTIDELYGSIPGKHSFVRFLYSIEQLGHSYTNMWVEYPRLLGGVMTKPANWFGRTKDVAYVVGHVIQFIPLIPIVWVLV
jgi:hypothetical protein